MGTSGGAHSDGMKTEPGMGSSSTGYNEVILFFFTCINMSVRQKTNKDNIIQTLPRRKGNLEHSNSWSITCRNDLMTQIITVITRHP